MTKLFEIERDFLSVKEYKNFISLKFPVYLGRRVTRDLCIEHGVVIPFDYKTNEYGVLFFLDHSDAVKFANHFVVACGELVNKPYEYIIKYAKGDL